MGRKTFFLLSESSFPVSVMILLGTPPENVKRAAQLFAAHDKTIIEARLGMQIHFQGRLAGFHQLSFLHRAGLVGNQITAGSNISSGLE